MIIFEKATPAVVRKACRKKDCHTFKTRMRRTERGQIDETKSFLAETRLDIEIAAEDMDESGVDFAISEIPKAIHFFSHK